MTEGNEPIRYYCTAFIFTENVCEKLPAKSSEYFVSQLACTNIDEREQNKFANLP